MEADLQNTEGDCDLLFVAGEHSGDEHAAIVIKDLLAANPSLKIKAIGGPEMAQAGADLMHDLTESSVVGLFEVLKHYSYFKTLFEKLLQWVEQTQPKMIITVDYPGFNLRLASALKDKGLSVQGGGSIQLYQYVSPQVWAWKPKRRFKIADCYDELGVIFPFEIDSYKDTDLEVNFVGHPFCREGYENSLSYDPHGELLLLPGSRQQAVSRILPILLETTERYLDQIGRPIRILYPSESIKGLLESTLQSYPRSERKVLLSPSEGGCRAAAVLTSSGTMSMKCALAGIPGAVVYRAHPITYWIGSRLVNVPYLGIANLVLNKEFYPEYIQGEARAAVLFERLQACLAKDEIVDQAASQADELKKLLSSSLSETPAARILKRLA